MKKTLTALSLILTTSLFSETALFNNRYSGYSYDPSKNVSKQQLSLIFQAAQSAPSCYNEQPWRFIVCDKNTHPKAYDKLLSSLVEFNQGWAKNAPVLIVSVVSEKSSRGHRNDWAEYDTGAATFGLVLQASSLGLMGHQMGGFDPLKIKTLFSIPEGFTPIAVTAIGYPSTDQAPLEKKRKPLHETFFMGDWGAS
jgi:nitroreductase